MRVNEGVARLTVRRRAPRVEQERAALPESPRPENKTLVAIVPAGLLALAMAASTALARLPAALRKKPKEP